MGTTATRRRRHRWLSAAGWTLLGLGVIAASIVKSQLPWVPATYLAAFVACGIAVWTLVRWQAGHRLLRWAGAGMAALGLIALTPVPWMQARLDDPPGTAWRLDGWLTVDGRTVDPAGAWYWLTAGRPPLMAELVAGWFGEQPAASDLRDGRAASQPRFSEPAAAAVGLRQAGNDISWSLHVEAAGPTVDGLPEQAAIVELNGVAVTDRDRWRDALATLSDANTFTTGDGEQFTFAGPAMPFQRVDAIEVPTEDVAIEVGGVLAGTPPGRWFRSLAVGRSHGMMVALVTYAEFTGEDLARRRTIAGTGKIHTDGSVGSIGGLAAKAGAARDVGADVLLFPAHQAVDLDGFEPGRMQLIPVSTLDEAIVALRG